MFGPPPYYYSPESMYGTTTGGDQLGMPQKTMQRGLLNPSPFTIEGRKFKRLNILLISLSLVLPWLVFALVLAMHSFWTHYRAPNIVQATSCALGALSGGLTIAAFGFVVRNIVIELPVTEDLLFRLFTCLTTFLGLACAFGLGNHNFWVNMEPYYDVINLNAYQGVDPLRMRGQEIMDAGRVSFVRGTQVDLQRSASFTNGDTYCVAPITGNFSGGNVPLASYDFFAVGTNCCLEGFQCGLPTQSSMAGGVRVVRDEDRAFYRLAVQQAQSTYAIRAIHPLFFHWVEDPDAMLASMRMNGFRFYLVSMFAFFFAQLFLVYVAVACFSGQSVFMKAEYS